MRALHLKPGAAAAPLALDQPRPDGGFVWIDVVRDDTPNWVEVLGAWLPVPIDAEHFEDSVSPTHPSSFESTDDYDLLVFEGLGPAQQWNGFETRRAAFFLFDDLVVSVHAPDSPAFGAVHDRLVGGRARSPQDPLRLVHWIVDAMVDRFLAFRESLDQRLTALQEQLLDPRGDAGGDWRGLLAGRRIARRIELMAGNQAEAIDSWRRSSRFTLDPDDEVRLRDLAEHVERVRDHASNLERDVESAVQLYFAMVSHRTNRVIQTLTVISAIFFPMTLVTGIYGMNFDHMPELHWRYGYLWALGLIVAVGVGLTLYFRRRHFFLPGR